jgi:hypothetical protein
VPVFIPIPEELTVPCVVKGRTVENYGEGTDVALEALEALAHCEENMAKIRRLGRD